MGVFAIGKWIWDRFAGLHVAFSASAALAASWSWFIWFLHDQAAIWLTALATIALWRATAMLTRATNVQQSREGPFLTITLEMDPPRDADVGTAPTADYLPGWQEDDSQHAFLGPRVTSTSPPRYVVLRVTNAQENPHGAASDITLETELAFGAPDDVAPHPYKIHRTVGPLTIFAGRYVEGALFNVAGLANWGVLITKVDYRDIMKRKRSAAVGAGGLFSSISGNILAMPRVFEPRKNEYTDAD